MDVQPANQARPRNNPTWRGAVAPSNNRSPGGRLWRGRIWGILLLTVAISSWDQEWYSHITISTDAQELRAALNRTAQRPYQYEILQTTTAGVPSLEKDERFVVRGSVVPGVGAVWTITDTHATTTYLEQGATRYRQMGGAWVRDAETTLPIPPKLDRSAFGLVEDPSVKGAARLRNPIAATLLAETDGPLDQPFSRRVDKQIPQWRDGHWSVAYQANYCRTCIAMNCCGDGGRLTIEGDAWTGTIQTYHEIYRATGSNWQQTNAITLTLTRVGDPQVTLPDPLGVRP